MEKEIKKKKSSIALPLSLAIIGLVAIGVTTYLLLKKAEEEQDLEQDVENYDTKNVPML